MTATFVNLASMIKLYQSLYRPLGLQEVEVPRISIQSAHEDGKAAFTLPSRRYPWYSFPLNGGSTPLTECC